MSAAALARASERLAARDFGAALAAADDALAGPLDDGVHPPERGEHVEYPERALALHCRGTALLELGRRPEAIAALSGAIAAARTPHALCNRGFARQGEGDDAGALADFSAAIALRSNYVHALSLRAQLYAARREWALAETDYASILAIDAQAAWARNGWREARTAQGFSADAT